LRDDKTKSIHQVIAIVLKNGNKKSYSNLLNTLTPESTDDSIIPTVVIGGDAVPGDGLEDTDVGVPSLFSPLSVLS
jgi:hypothetical protein